MCQKGMCGCEVYTYANIMHEYLIYWIKNELKQFGNIYSGRPRIMLFENRETRYSQ